MKNFLASLIEKLKRFDSRDFLTINEWLVDTVITSY